MSEVSSSTKQGDDLSHLRLDRNLKVFDRLVAAVSSLALVFGGLFGMFRYLDTRHREVNVQALAAEQAMLKEKQETYLALCDAACAIATCENETEVKARAKDYLRLYLGKVHMLANLEDKVVAKKIKFGHELIDFLKIDEKAPYSKFAEPALKLVGACRDSIENDRRKIQARMSKGTKSDEVRAVNAGGNNAGAGNSDVDGA
jgi:hypothetical protein